MLKAILAVALVGGASFVAGMQVERGGVPEGASVAAVGPGEARSSALAAPFAVEDAAGDAKDLAPTRLGYGPACLLACEGLPVSPGLAGPDAAIFDLLEVGAEDRPGDVVLALRLAALTEGFPEMLAAPATHRVAEYEACWQPEDHGRRCAMLNAVPHHGGAALTASFHVRDAEPCHEWGLCLWSVPFEVRYGSPAEIRFLVPKAYAAYDGAPLALDGLRGVAGWFSTNKAVPLWHLAWTLHVDGNHQHDHVGLLEPANIADLTEPAEGDPRLAPCACPLPDAGSQPLLSPGAGALAGSGGLRDYPELDLLAFDLRQEGEDLVATFAFAGFEAMPPWDFQFAALFGVRDGLLYEVGAMQPGGSFYGYAGRCISFGCHEGFLDQVPLELHAGSPGFLEVRAPRATWDDLPDGAEVNFYLAYTMYGEANKDLGNAGDPVYGNVHSGSVVDAAFGGFPYVLGSDHAGVFDLEAPPGHA